MMQPLPASQIFQQLSDHQLLSDGARLSTRVKVEAGDISGFRRGRDTFGLLIPLSEDESRAFKADRKSQAIQLTRVLEERDNGVVQPFARLALLEPLHKHIFSIFVDELLSELCHNSDRPADRARVMLQRWRHLFSMQISSASFGPEKQVGLICELEILKTLITELGADAITRWTGPEALPHDFELEDESIECKAITAVNGIRISINGTSQLAETPGKDLRLIVRRYLPNPDGQLSVPDLCRDIYENYPIAVESFLEKLNKIGCPVFHSKTTTDFVRFDPVGTHEFIVNDDFPKVPHRGLNTRISNVQYILDLSGPELIPGLQKTNRYIKELND